MRQDKPVSLRVTDQNFCIESLKDVLIILEGQWAKEDSQDCLMGLEATEQSAENSLLGVSMTSHNHTRNITDKNH